MRRIPATVNRYHVIGRTPGSGPVVAVFTDCPTDLPVAAAAASWAADTRTLLVAAAAVTDPGFSLNPLLHRAAERRLGTESVAIVGRVTPVLTAIGVAWIRATIAVPAGVDPARSLPATTVRDLVDRYAAVGVVTAAALDDPSGRLVPLTRDASVTASAREQLREYH